MKVWSTENTSTRHVVRDGVVHFEVVGRMHQADLYDLYQDGPLGQVMPGVTVSYCDCVQAPLADGFRPMGPPLESCDRIAGMLPGALVVREEDEEAYRDYAWAMAQRGVVRGVFTEPSRAKEWLQARLSTLAQHSRRTRSFAPARRAPGASAPRPQ